MDALGLQAFVLSVGRMGKVGHLSEEGGLANGVLGGSNMGKYYKVHLPTRWDRPMKWRGKDPL